MKKDVEEKALKALERQTRQYKRQNAYIAEHYKRLTITVRKDIGAIISSNESSVNGYINALIKDDLQRRGLLPPDSTGEE